MSLATRPIASPITQIHSPEARQEPPPREIQLSGSDLEILIDNSKPRSLPPSQRHHSRAPSLRPPAKPSSRALVRTGAETPAAKREATQQSNRRVMLGVTALLWGAMTVTAIALQSPAYRDTPSSPLEAAALQDLQRN